MTTRTESDSLGPRDIPQSALYGIQTLRAVENFPVSGWRFPRSFIRALGLVKGCVARAHGERGLLDPRMADAIAQSADEVADGRWDDHFPVDIFQTGSGTSTHMNANEVIAHLANERLGGSRGDKRPVHPNDHVNRGQSSNDVMPTALHVAALESLVKDLAPALERLRDALLEKSRAWDPILKIGRTHLQDAVPMRLGQEFGGYAEQVVHGLERLAAVQPHLAELALGGTAVGTGLNADPAVTEAAIARLGAVTGLPFRGARSRFEALAARDAAVAAGGALKTVAVSLIKIANDVRWLSSGPRCGIGEIEVPALQPGSSIMPGKVNPVIPESVAMVGAHVIGADAAITVAGQSGHFELNVMVPLISYHLLTSISLLARVSRLFADTCIAGLRPRPAVAEGYVENSLALGTALVPALGYDRAVELVKKAHATGRTVRQVAREDNLLSDSELDRLLDVRAMTEPGGAG